MVVACLRQLSYLCPLTVSKDDSNICIYWNVLKMCVSDFLSLFTLNVVSNWEF